MSTSSIRPSSRTILFVIIGLFAGLVGLPQAHAQDSARTAVDRQVDARPAPVDHLEVLQMRCDVDIIGDARGVLCRWRPAKNDNVRAYQLYRIVNGDPRELVATVTPGERLRAFDTDIEPGDRLVYGLVARNPIGRVIAQSRPARIAIPR